jgi:hypothetical protein
LSIKENNFNENCKKSIDPTTYAIEVPGPGGTGVGLGMD